MKKTTYLAIACTFLLLAGGLYYFLKDESLVPKPPVEATKSEPTTLSYVGNSIIEERDGKRLWELSAETIEIEVDTKNLRLKNIKGIFYQENGGKVDITAPEAVMDSKTKEVLMSGKVQAVASDGASFTASETRWSNEQKRFYGSGNVLLTKDDTVLTGDKIESDTNMEKVKVYGNAKIIKGGVPR